MNTPHVYAAGAWIGDGSDRAKARVDLPVLATKGQIWAAQEQAIRAVCDLMEWDRSKVTIVDSPSPRGVWPWIQVWTSETTAAPSREATP